MATETEGYTYRVLTIVGHAVHHERSRGASRTLADLADHPGRTPDSAIEHAVENGGLPREDGGRCIAVPVSRWHERDVTIKQVPTISVDAAEDVDAELVEDDITADPR